MRRWATALLALGLGVSVSAALLVFASPDRNTVEVYAAARDIPAGSSISPDSVVKVRVSSTGLPSLLFTGGDQATLTGLHAKHELTAVIAGAGAAAGAEGAVSSSEQAATVAAQP